MPQETDNKNERNPADANAMVILIALALTGGFADAAAYLLVGSFTGHITGNTVLAALALGAGKISAVWLHLTAIAAFMLATAVGLVLPRLIPSKNGALALALIVEAALIGFAASARLLHSTHTNLYILVCLCLALGLQNGIFSKSEGVSVHGTYITGDATSLLVSLLRRPEGGSSKSGPDKHTTIRVLGVTWPCFAVGAVVAAFAVHRFGANALWLLEVPLVVATIFAWERPTGVAL